MRGKKEVKKSYRKGGGEGGGGGGSNKLTMGIKTDASMPLSFKHSSNNLLKIFLFFIWPYSTQ